MHHGYSTDQAMILIIGLEWGTVETVEKLAILHRNAIAAHRTRF
jgi:hypothetical protein